MGQKTATLDEEHWKAIVEVIAYAHKHEVLASDLNKRSRVAEPALLEQLVEADEVGKIVDQIEDLLETHEFVTFGSEAMSDEMQEMVAQIRIVPKPRRKPHNLMEDGDTYGDAF